jgi:hypothetical protein
MSKDDELNRAVGDLFDQYLRYDQTLDDSKVLDALLPDNSTVVRGLGERCFEEARNRLRAGHHTEGRRLEILGRQLLQRADKGKGSSAWGRYLYGFGWAALGRARGMSRDRPLCRAA